MAKVITVLGSTGSIGTQSLDVIKKQGYSVLGLAAFSNVNLLLKQICEFNPKYVAVCDNAAADELCVKLSNMQKAPLLLRGEEGIAKLAGLHEADIVLNAIVGIAGLKATLTALDNGIDVALANKESLVAGGSLVIDAAQKSGAKLLPVDSEHSAIFQCLQDEYSRPSLEKILLTASGGPFFGKTKGELALVKKEDALRHPNWSMGNKITIDSATLMNKGLELIEAVWLFGLPCNQIEIVVQRQSIVHSMVQFADNSVLAQLGVPDMRIPIQYALTFPNRVIGSTPALDFKTLHTLTFEQADENTFRCLAACKKAIKKGGLAPCAANGANEEAVRLFLNDEIPFLSIGKLVEAVVDSQSYGKPYTLAQVYACDAQARKFVQENKALI